MSTGADLEIKLYVAASTCFGGYLTIIKAYPAMKPNVQE